MTTSKSRVARYAALGAAAALVLAGCAGGSAAGEIFDDCEENPNECNSVAADELQDGGEITFVLEKNIENWNVNSAQGNVLETGMAIKEILPYTHYTKPDLTTAVNEDLLDSVEMINDDPQTLEYQVKEEAQWSNGTPIDVEDFIYNWKVNSGEHCPECEPASTAGFDQIESIEGSDDGKTVTVTFEESYADWRSLWASGGPMYPAHIAAEHGDLDTEQGLADAYEWFGKNVPDYSGSAFQIADWENEKALTLEPNENYWGEEPNADRIIFRVITEAAEEPTALQNREVDVIYPQPQVDLVEQVNNIPDVSSYIGMGLTWEHIDFNLENEFLAGHPLREALFTAVDRQGMIDKTVGQFTDKAEPLNNHNFVPGQDGYEDVVSDTGQGSGDVEGAKEILTEAGYTGVGEELSDPDGNAVDTLRIRYDGGNQIRQSIAELFVETASELGVTVEIDPTDDLGGTLSEGDYDIMLFGWVASPFPYGGAQQLWHSESGSNFGGYSDPEVDKLVVEAAQETDTATANEMLNEADRIMTEDAYVLPLYQKPTFIAAYNDIANVRNNSTLDSPTYNLAEWGVRAE